MRGIQLIIPFVFSVAAAGCYSEADVGYGGGGYVASPSLVYAAPGVQVIADYDEPIFFSDGLYWRSYGGAWYSSRVYNGGWAMNYNVPYGVRGIREPGAYAHYRGGGYAGPTYRGGAYHGGGPAVRDHRAYSAPAPAYRSAPAARGPVVRDHRR
jgi:hypothetical protein